jgi:hypothetical protein
VHPDVVAPHPIALAVRRIGRSPCRNVDALRQIERFLRQIVDRLRRSVDAVCRIAVRVRHDGVAARRDVVREHRIEKNRQGTPVRSSTQGDRRGGGHANGHR